MGINTRAMLLLDAVGALVSALMLLVVLLPWHHQAGLPPLMFVLLGLLALLMSGVGFVCLAKTPDTHSGTLRTLVKMNAGYMFLTATVLIVFVSEIRLWGWIYFFGEILVILLVIILEIEMIKHVTNTNIKKKDLNL